MDLESYVRERLGAVEVDEIAEGHQSRVFVVRQPGGRRLVAKLLDASAVDVDEVAARVDAVARAAALDPLVCAPIPVDGRLVDVIDVIDRGDDRRFLLLCSEFAEGDALDVHDAGDAETLGATLARLHRTLALVDAPDVPVVPAMRAVGTGTAEPVQLLHGDFNAGNVRRSGSIVKVFDFEDCGYGPPMFDVANALYMVMFDVTVGEQAPRYTGFERAFLAGYTAESGQPADLDRIDRYIELRVRALERWLDEPSTAPAGIRNASPEWHATLRSFVGGHPRGHR